MASELRVNSSTNRSGLGTITYTDSGPIVSGVGTFTNGLTVDGTQTTVKSLKLTGDSYNVNWFKTSHKLRFNDNAKATFGTADDLSIYHDGSNNYIEDAGTGSLILKSNHLIGNAGAYSFMNAANSQTLIYGVEGGAVQLFHSGSKKFETTNTGVTVTGTAVAGALDISGDIDVDGHTNLDNVSIAGVTTITGSGNALEIVGGLVRSRNTASARFVANNGSAEGYFGWSSGVLTVGQAAATLSLEATGSNHIQLKTNGNERLRIDTNGRVLFSRGGLTASRNVGTKTGEIQVANTGNSSAITIIGYSNDVTGPHLMFGKTRSTNATGNTIVQDGDRLGEIAFCGNDGSDLDSFGAAIKCHVDGTPGANDMPGRLQFYTTPDGGSSSVERMRIDSSGNLTFQNSSTSATANLSQIIFANGVGEAASIRGATRNGNTNGMIIFNTDISGSSAERMRIGHDGAFCFGSDSARPAEFTRPSGFSVRWDQKGQFQSTVSNETCGLLNREGSDGGILSFRRGGTGVGEIGVNANTMYLNFGGTNAAAHQLDDYEEGSFTITAAPSSSGTLTLNSSYNTGVYTRVGNLVHIQAYLSISGNNSATGYVQLSSLPFTVDSNQAQASGHVRAVQIVYLNGQYAYLPDGAGYYNAQLYCNEGNTWIRLYDLNDKGRRIDTIARHLSGGADLFLNFSYLAA